MLRSTIRRGWRRPFHLFGTNKHPQHIWSLRQMQEPFATPRHLFTALQAAIIVSVSARPSKAVEVAGPHAWSMQELYPLLRHYLDG